MNLTVWEPAETVTVLGVKPLETPSTYILAPVGFDEAAIFPELAIACPVWVSVHPIRKREKIKVIKIATNIFIVGIT